MQLTSDVTQQMIDNAINQSPIVQIGLAQSALYNQAVYAEQTTLLNFVANYPIQEINISTLQGMVLDRIDQDIAITSSLNDAIAYNQFYTENEMTYALKTNKMDEALTGSRELIADTQSFEAIIKGEFPEGYGCPPPFAVMIGEVSCPFGNSHNTFLSTALIEVATTLMGPDASVLELNAAFNGLWADNSSIAHITPINETIFQIDPSLAQRYLDNYTFSFHDSETDLGLAYIHSGYAFGGFREEDRYAEGKLFGPEDCSSWLAKLTQCDVEFSTYDMFYTYREQTETNHDYVDPTWRGSSTATAMFETFSPVQVIDPHQDIQPGQIIVFRKFTSEDHSGIGYSGHTGLVLGLTEDNQVLTLNYTRNMPDVEGFGISLFDYRSDDVKEVIFLEVNNPPLHLSDIIQVNESDLAFWDQTSLSIQDLNLTPSYVSGPLFEQELNVDLPTPEFL